MIADVTKKWADEVAKPRNSEKIIFPEFDKLRVEKIDVQKAIDEIEKALEE